MSKDYERLCASGESMVYAAMIRLMTRRLAHRTGTEPIFVLSEFCELHVALGVLRKLGHAAR